MNGRTSHFGHMVRINRNLLGAALLAVLAALSWPESLEWWGFGLISIFCALAALSLAVGAARLMVQIYKKDQAVAVFLAQGKEPKASALVSDRGLRDAGMCDE